MIIKSFELNKIKLENENFFLLYGENSGLKDDIIRNIESKTKKKFEKFKFNEKELLENSENFYNLINSGTLFDTNKLVIINNITDKLIKIIDDIKDKEKKILIFFLANILDKKSKIRNLFEKNKELVCIPCYDDNNITLNNILIAEIKKENIKISQESINLLIDRSSGDRQNLKNEIEKIKAYATKKKTLTIEEIKILTNLSDNFDNEEIINNCLAGNQKKLKRIIEENNFSSEDYFILFKILSKKVQRLFEIKSLIDSGKKMDVALKDIKPMIFWKEKEIVGKQIKMWNLKQLRELLSKLNDVELLCKKNNEIAVNIILDFISNISFKLNNSSSQY